MKLVASIAALVLFPAIAHAWIHGDGTSYIVPGATPYGSWSATAQPASVGSALGTLTASSSGTTLTVTNCNGVTLEIGDEVAAGDMAAPTVITAFGSGTGCNGTYTTAASNTVSSETMTAYPIGYSAFPVAVWDDVPYQTFSGSHWSCVDAIHSVSSTVYASGDHYGISKVTFVLNDGTPYDVTVASTTNSPSGFPEYCVPIKAGLLTDGIFELRATVVPAVGKPIVLQGAQSPATTVVSAWSMRLNANAGGTLPAKTYYVACATCVAPYGPGNDSNDGLTTATPLATISAARNAASTFFANAKDVGGAVVLMAECPSSLLPPNDFGCYSLGGVTESTSYLAATQWFQIASAPGAAPAKVVISTQNASNGIRTAKIRFTRLSFANLTGLSNGGTTPLGWMDNSTFTGASPFLPTSRAFKDASWDGGLYITESTIQYVETGCARACTLLRNLTFSHIGSDVLNNPIGLLNVTADTLLDTWPGTGDFTNGSAVITNVSDSTFAYAVVGAAMGSTATGCNTGGCPTTITAFDATAHTITLSAAATSNGTALTFGTGFHPDTMAFNLGRLGPILIRGYTATNAINGQGPFLFVTIGNPALSDIALVGVSVDNSLNTGRNNLNVDTLLTNFLMLDDTFAGGNSGYSSPGYTGVGNENSNLACSPTKTLVPAATLWNASPTCH